MSPFEKSIKRLDKKRNILFACAVNMFYGRAHWSYGFSTHVGRELYKTQFLVTLKCLENYNINFVKDSSTLGHKLSRFKTLVQIPMQVFSGFRIQSVQCPRSSLLSAWSRKNIWKKKPFLFGLHWFCCAPCKIPPRWHCCLCDQRKYLKNFWTIFGGR